MFSFFAFVAIVVLFIQLTDTRCGLKRAEATVAEALSGAGIDSCVALGFSLIGIGWLYSRQLAGTATDAATD